MRDFFFESWLWKKGGRFFSPFFEQVFSVAETRRNISIWFFSYQYLVMEKENYEIKSIFFYLFFQDEGVHWGAREDWPSDPRPGQEEQPLDGEGKVQPHVKRIRGRRNHHGLARFQEKEDLTFFVCFSSFAGIISWFDVTEAYKDALPHLGQNKKNKFDFTNIWKISLLFWCFESMEISTKNLDL